VADHQRSSRPSHVSQHDHKLEFEELALMSDHNFTKRSDNPAQSAADGPHRARVSQQDVNPSRSTLRARLLAGVAAIALTAGAIATHQSFGIEDAWAANTTPQSAILAQRNAAKTGSMPDFVDLVQALKPAVVSVRVKANLQPQLSMMQGENPFKGTPFEKFFRQFGDEATPGSGNMLKPHLARAQGSAFFITPDGYLVTNNHVIDKAVEVEITMDDGTTMPAKVVGADPKTDIALLKVSGREDFPYV